MHLDEETRWLQWCGWYETAYKDVLTLLHNRHVWRNLIAMLAANPEVEQHTMINNWFTRCYSQTQAVGVRRQSEHEGRRPTLGALLREIESFPSIATRVRYVSGLSDASLPNRENGWRTFAPDDGPLADTDIVSADRQKLTVATTPVRDWVNKAVAHRDKDETTTTAPIETSFASINGALDVLAELIRKYHMLFHPGAALWRVTPTTSPDWTEMFRKPWYSEQFEPVDPWDLG
jgi:hypothetical protein